MKKIAKIVQCMVLCGFMCVASPRQGYCFLTELLPPLPFDITIDFGDNATKVISYLKAMYREVQTIETALNSEDLVNIKGGNLGEIASATLGKYVKGPKTPSQDPIKKSDALGLKEGEVRQENYVDAFRTLFLTTGGDQEQRINYHKKAIEFKQDMTINAYVNGRLTEDYLIMVEKTINRLEKCQRGDTSAGCTFFGLAWSEVTSTNDVPEGDDNPGLMGAVRNAYIVMTVYDRLVRIVEDLAATEAMFESARNLDLAKPAVAGETSSDASQYINKKFHFSYHQTNETSYASNSVASLGDRNIAKILGKLQQIDQWQQEAMILHNLKVKLPEYKAMYRKYLKAKQVHERTLKVLKGCDTCAKTFLNTYDNGLTESWGETSPVNDYASRTGISRDLINKYQEAVQTTIIETSEDLCPGYYTGDCPAGYEPGDTCKIITMNEIRDPQTNKLLKVEEHTEEMSEYHECNIAMASQDTGETIDRDEIDDVTEQPGDKEALKLQGDAEYMEKGASADEVHKDSRIKSERTWRVGEKKLMDLTRSHQLKFLPWNDQKNLQEMYLRQKYNNLKLITMSADDGVNTFKVAKDYVENDAYSAARTQSKLEADEGYQRAKAMIKAATKCKAATDAVADAKAEWCPSSCDPSRCDVRGNDASGLIEGKKPIWKDHTSTDDEGNTSTETKCDGWESKTWKQYVDVETGSPDCAFTQAPKELEPLATSGCPGNWDLTAEFLIKNYFKAVQVLGNCAETTKDAAENMRTTAKAKDRRVAQDILSSIVQLREEQDKKLKAWVKAYEANLSGKRQQLVNLKERVAEVNHNVDVATQLKNAAVQEKKRSELRVSAITREIGELTQQIEVNKGQPVVNQMTGELEPDIKQQCSLEVRIYKLKYEGHAICKGADVEKHKHCKDYSTNLEPWGESYTGYNVCEKVREKEKPYLKEGDAPFTEDIKVINNLKEDNFIVAFAQNLESKQHVKLVESDEIIDEQDRILVNLKAERDVLNNEIAALKEQIETEARGFAEDYVAKETKNQQDLMDLNDVFEAYVENDTSNRMQKGLKRICKRVPPIIGSKQCEDVPAYSFREDNLKSTLQHILYEPIGLPGKDKIIWQGFEDTWGINNIDIVKTAIENLGVHREFKGVGTMSNINTPEQLAEAVRDLIVVAATNVLSDYIEEIDEAVKKERLEAKVLIKNLSDELVGENRATEQQLEVLSEHDNYAENGEITNKHNTLLQNLRTPKYLNVYGVTNLNDFFGIPDDADLYTIPECKMKVNNEEVGCFSDDKYFVALPARGNNYIDKLPTDENAGRDFRSPNEPLLNLPPLREVFYFSTLDYEDIPINNGVPAWTIFLNKKFVEDGWGDYPQQPTLDDDVKEWEYMPETWLYLLARPNMRNDGKYKHTFEERSYGDGAIKDLLLKPGQNDDGYKYMIARSGVYPCRLVDSKGKSTIFDMGPKTVHLGIINYESPQEMAFAKGKSIVQHLPECKEIAFNSDRTTPCGIYNKGKSGICHLLADHGMKNDQNELIIDNQTSLGSVNSKAYEKYSELGNLFKFQESHPQYPWAYLNMIVYRPMQENIHLYLLSEDHTDNDIDRQKVDRALFTHSIFSTFLDAVNMEHNAKKNLDNTKQNLEEALANLCQQIHAQGQVVGDYAVTKDCDEACKNQACVTWIMDNGGLATSPDEDSKYGESNEYDPPHDNYPDFRGISCNNGTSNSSFYEELFCKLDEWKNEKIELSRNAERIEEVDGENVMKLGFNKLDKAKTESEKEKSFNIVTDPDKVKERMQIIYNFDTALTADNNETVFLSPTIGKLYVCPPGGELDKAPNAIKEEIEKEKITSKKNRTAGREGDEDAIKAMGNQFQMVPYCPLYMNNKKTGL